MMHRSTNSSLRKFCVEDQFDIYRYFVGGWFLTVGSTGYLVGQKAIAPFNYMFVYILFLEV